MIRRGKAAPAPTVVFDDPVLARIGSVLLAQANGVLCCADAPGTTVGQPPRRYFEDAPVVGRTGQMASSPRRSRACARRPGSIAATENLEPARRGYVRGDVVDSPMPSIAPAPRPSPRSWGVRPGTRKVQWAARRMWACCPFHGEHTQLHARREGRYHCFGCACRGPLQVPDETRGSRFAMPSRLPNCGIPLPEDPDHRRDRPMIAATADPERSLVI